VSAPSSPIVEVEAIPLQAAPKDPADLDSSSHTILVRLTDEAGRTGIGETDAPPTAVRELVLMDDLFAWSRGLRNAILGRDPFELGALHDELYGATIYHGRRGLGVHALSAVDIALHDLLGKQLGRPAYQLLGGARREALTPYATIWPGAVLGRSIGEMMNASAAQFEHALALGFAAVKMEVIFGDLVTDGELVECIREGRRLLGDDVTMLVDFGYRWSDWRDALWVLRRVEDCDLYLAEATLGHDDLAGHAKLAEGVEMRVAGAEFAATVAECREWLERGGVDVLQPDVNRCGGLTELRKIALVAELAGASVVPHGWKTGITVAAALHFHAATANAPYVEMLHPDLYDSPLRAELVRPEPAVRDGSVPLPTEPGLGIEVVEEAIERYRAG
jgi:L-rhamnonate dehydratase